MSSLKFRFCAKLDELDQQQLDEITSDGHSFACTEWFRLLDQLDLPKLIGGKLQLFYAVGELNGRPIVICPIFRACGEGMYFVYSIRRYFFEHWIEDAIRIQPDRTQHFARLMKGVNAYRKLLQLTGSPLDDALVISSPLSYRCAIPVAPMTSLSRDEIYGELIDELKRMARQKRIPLWFLAVEDNDTRLARALRGSGFDESFLFYDNVIELDTFGSFDDYLHSFRRTTRRAFQRDMKRARDAGMSFSFVDNYARHGETLTKLYSQTYRKYGGSFFHHPPEFWSSLTSALGKKTEAICAWNNEELAGFSVLIKNVRRSEMWTYRVGRTEDVPADNPFYFSLSFYGPIQRAIELGFRRLWLGPASYDAKSVRGAKQIPLTSFFWFPRRWDRWLLAPYLKVFGQEARKQIDESLHVPVRKKQEEAQSAEPVLESAL